MTTMMTTMTITINAVFCKKIITEQQQKQKK